MKLIVVDNVINHNVDMLMMIMLMKMLMIYDIICYTELYMMLRKLGNTFCMASLLVGANEFIFNYIPPILAHIRMYYKFVCHMS